MTCNLLKNIFFLEIARLFRGTSHFWDIEMFCFREIMLALKYVIRTIAVLEDLKLLFSGDCNTSVFGRLNCVIFGRLKDAVFGRLKYLIFGKLKYFNFWEIEMCHFREVEMCHIREIAMCHFREIEMCYFGEIEMCYLNGTNICGYFFFASKKKIVFREY